LTRDATTDTKSALLNNLNTPEDEDAAASIDAETVANDQQAELDEAARLEEEAAQKEAEAAAEKEAEAAAEKEAEAAAHGGHG